MVWLHIYLKCSSGCLTQLKKNGADWSRWWSFRVTPIPGPTIRYLSENENKQDLPFIFPLWSSIFDRRNTRIWPWKCLSRLWLRAGYRSWLWVMVLRSVTEEDWRRSRVVWHTLFLRFYKTEGFREKIMHDGPISSLCVRLWPSSKISFAGKTRVSLFSLRFFKANIFEFRSKPGTSYKSPPPPTKKKFSCNFCCYKQPVVSHFRNHTGWITTIWTYNQTKVHKDEQSCV